MINCTLGDRTYSVDYISGRALREIEPAYKMYAKIAAVSEAAVKGKAPDADDTFSISEAMDVMIRWFCLLFGNHFTPDEVYDRYPVDRLMHDIVMALIAVQSQTTEVLTDFPTTAEATET